MKPAVKYQDFEKLDLRIGKVVGAEEVSGSDKLQKLILDFGKESGQKTILAGIRAFYSTNDLLGKSILVLFNLEPKKMMGEESQGMLLVAEDDGRPVLLIPEEQVPAGCLVK